MGNEKRGLHKKFFVYKARPCECPVVSVERPSGHSPSCKGPKRGELLDDVFVLRPERDGAARAALWAYALETSSEELRADLLKWLGRISSTEEREIRTSSAALLWCHWHDAEVSHDWGRPSVHVRVPIFAKPPGYIVKVARWECEEGVSFRDAVHALAKRLGTGSEVFSLEWLAKREASRG